MNKYVDYDIILPESIKRIKKHRYFVGYQGNKLNSIIHKDVIECMTTSLRYARHKEVLIIRGNMGTKGINYGDYNEVKMTNKMIDIAINEYSYIVHNHPTEISFSIKDIKTFLRYTNIKFMIVCTNTCKYIGIMYKTKNIGRVSARNAIKIINSMPIDYLYNNTSILSKIGVDYRWYKNY